MLGMTSGAIMEKKLRIKLASEQYGQSTMREA